MLKIWTTHRDKGGRQVHIPKGSVDRSNGYGWSGTLANNNKMK